MAMQYHLEELQSPYLTRRTNCRRGAKNVTFIVAKLRTAWTLHLLHLALQVWDETQSRLRMDWKLSTMIEKNWTG